MEDPQTMTPRYSNNIVLQSVKPEPKRARFALSASLVLAICYVLILPAGRMGAYLALASLGVGFVALNRDTLATYLLLFGTGTFGTIAVALNYPGFGGKIAGVVGLFLVVSDRRFQATADLFKRSVLWVSWIGIVLSIWYFMGPQTKYCQGLLVGYFINTALAIAGFSYLLWKRSINWWALGQLAVVSSLAVLAVSAVIEPSLLPNHLLDFAVLRPKFYERGFSVSTHDLAYMAAMGAIMVAYASPDRPLTRLARALIIANIAIGALMVGWTFHRTSIVAFAAAFVMAPLVRPRFRKRYRFFGVLTLLAIAVVLVVTYANEPDLFVRVLDTGRSVSSRLNRSTNWNAAFYCIQQKPWIGHGLGGYYIPGFSSPGEGTFAHSLFFGLLSELGIIGTGMILLPLVPLLWRVRGDFSPMVRSANGGAIMPVLMPIFLMTMTSGDIVDHSSFFALIAVLAENWPKSSQTE